MQPTKQYEPEIKVVDGPRGLIEGWGIPFGGPVAGRDLDGEFFDAKTEFHFDWFPDGRPMLYDHGTDPDVGLSIVGRQTEYKVVEDIGVWVSAQLNLAHQYAKAILELIDKKALGFSSLAMRHLISKEPSGRIATWPWIEQTLTVHPANPTATIESAKALGHMKTLGLSVPASMMQKSKKAITLPDGMSIDDAQQAIRATIRDEYPALFDDEDYLWINEMYEATVIVSVEERYYEIAYTLGTDGAVSLPGQPKEVRRKTDWEPVPKDGKGGRMFTEELSVAVASLADVTAFVERAKSLVNLRAKDGRELKHRERLAELVDHLSATTQEAQAMLKEASPFDAAEGAQLFAAFQQTRRTLADLGVRED